jgi:hypothetical protein
MPKGRKTIEEKDALRMFCDLHKSVQRAGTVSEAVAKRIRSNLELLAEAPTKRNSETRNTHVHKFFNTTLESTIPIEALVLLIGTFTRDDFMTMGAIRREPNFRKVEDHIAKVGFVSTTMMNWVQENRAW